jgi:hypothetical protein
VAGFLLDGHATIGASAARPSQGATDPISLGLNARKMRKLSPKNRGTKTRKRRQAPGPATASGGGDAGVGEGPIASLISLSKRSHSRLGPPWRYCFSTKRLSSNTT